MEQQGHTKHCGRSSIITLQQGAVAAAGAQVVLVYLMQPLDRQQACPHPEGIGWLPRLQPQPLRRSGA